MEKKNERVYTIYGMIATCLGIGVFSSMPGTMGTAVALTLFLLTGRSDLLLTLVISVIGAIAADKYVKVTVTDNPREVVIGDVSGFFVSMWNFERRYAIVGFFLFRVVAILKPFPMKYAAKLPGGAGIMACSICGGAMVNILLRALEWLFFVGGFETMFKFLGIGA
jgi:phosphatidylglycerophosphatase A